MTAHDGGTAGPEALAALHRAALPGSRTWSAQEFAALCAARGAILRSRPGQGFALGRASADEAELLMLAVLPDRRRQGLGRALLGAFEADAARRGAHIALLEVDATNAPAIALYAGAGYVERGRRRAYYRSPAGERADALILGKRLFRQT